MTFLVTVTKPHHILTLQLKQEGRRNRTCAKQTWIFCATLIRMPQTTKKKNNQNDREYPSLPLTRQNDTFLCLLLLHSTTKHKLPCSEDTFPNDSAHWWAPPLPLFLNRFLFRLRSRYLVLVTSSFFSFFVFCVIQIELFSFFFFLFNFVHSHSNFAEFTGFDFDLF